MESTINPNTIRVRGNAMPAYLKGMPRQRLIQALAPKRPAKPAAVVTSVAAQLRGTGAAVGEGVPFAALYMTRSDKKIPGLQLAA